MNPEPVYAISPRASLADELQRIAVEQLLLVRSSLQILRAGDGRDIEEPVHEARKAFKRLRALVRLLAGSCSGDAYARHNAWMRDAARLLSGGRDAHVMALSLRTLLKDLPPSTREALEPVAQELERRAGAVAEQLGGAELAPIEELLAHIEEDLGSLLPLKPRRGRLVAAAAAAYRGNRRDMRAARRGGTEELFHEWRKSVKHLRHHTEIFRPFAPELLGAFEVVVRALADVLGDHQDLSVLAAELRLALVAQQREDATALSLQEALERLEFRQIEQRAAALELGRQLLAETPRAYRARLRACWRSAPA